MTLVVKVVVVIVEVGVVAMQEHASETTELAKLFKTTMSSRTVGNGLTADDRICTFN